MYYYFQVASKPYQASTGAELAKLCNHKRKLLATLQARGGGASGTPPPQLEQKKGIVTDFIDKTFLIDLFTGPCLMALSSVRQRTVSKVRMGDRLKGTCILPVSNIICMQVQGNLIIYLIMI